VVSSIKNPALITLVSILLANVCLTGCTFRQTLDPKELNRVDKEGVADKLRLYPSRRLVLFFDEEETERTYDVDRKIRRTERREPKKRTTKWNAPGKIIARTDSNGMTVLWVSWRSDCNKVECAYGFVRTEDNRYKLFDTPRKQGYKAPREYRRTAFKHNRLKPGRVEALSEANKVLLKKNVLKKVKTVDLQIKVFRRNRRRPDRKTNHGYD